MDHKTVDQLIALLSDLFHHSREHAVKFRALEQVARDHPEIFAEYENYVSEIRTAPDIEKSSENTLIAVDRLRTALRQE